jgi:4-carboxymuconolactone decarboxylase
MDDAARTLIRLSAAVAMGSTDVLDRELAAAAALVNSDAVEEALLQSYLFLGYPAALRALAAWRTLSGVAAPDTPTVDEADWAARGAATCERVYGGQYAALRSNIAALHPDMERWMITEGYGKVLSRPGLGLALRELCIVALLAPQDAAPQLYSHLRGALNAGASAADVAEAVSLLETLLERSRADQLTAQWAAVCARRDNQPDGD